METIFSKIISGDIPAHVVYENEHVIAFLDIAPVHPGHTLVVPKQYARNILDISSDSWRQVADAVRIISPAIIRATGADGVNIIMNNEPAAHQVVFHAHVHVIPRFTDDGLKSLPHGSYKEGEEKVVREKIRQALA